MAAARDKKNFGKPKPKQLANIGKKKKSNNNESKRSKGGNKKDGKPENKGNKPAKVEREEETDEEIDEETVEFIQQNASRLSFLNRLADDAELDSKNQLATRRRKEKAKQLEENFERQPRNLKKVDDSDEEDDDDEENTTLPVKLSDGRVMQPKREKVEPVAVDDEAENENDDYDDSNVEMDDRDNHFDVDEDENENDETYNAKEYERPSRVKEMTEDTMTLRAIAEREEQLVHIKQNIAKSSILLMEDPQENIEELRVLLLLSCHHEPIVQKWAMLSTAKVFSDIIPGYKIKESSEETQDVKLSKEVRELRHYEQQLVLYYHKFIQILNNPRTATVSKAAEKERQFARKDSRSVRVVAVKCLAQLLHAVPHFNHSKVVVNSMVSRLDHSDAEIAEIAANSISTFFGRDRDRQSILDTVLRITNTVKKRGHHIPARLIRCCLALKLNAAIPTASTESAKGKNISKEERQLKRDMKQSEASTSATEDNRITSAILETLMAMYFRVLKMGHVAQHLLPPVLQGLAKFAHLINIEFMSDLLLALQSLLHASQNNDFTSRLDDDSSSQEVSLPMEPSLHCLLAVFRILQNQGEVWNMDLKSFYVALYRIIRKLPEEVSCVNADSDRIVALVLEACHVMLMERRQIAVGRLRGMVKGLVLGALHLPTPYTLALLGQVFHLVQRHPHTKRLIEEEHANGDRFLLDIMDPEAAHPEAATAWELGLMHIAHYHPTVRSLSAVVASLTDPSGAHKTIPDSLSLLNDFTTAQGGFNPAIKPPSQHPLKLLAVKFAKKSKRGDSRRFYITPLKPINFGEEKEILPQLEDTTVSQAFDIFFHNKNTKRKLLTIKKLHKKWKSEHQKPKAKKKKSIANNNNNNNRRK